jgi:glycerol-3-phosphate dehydrogenase
MGLGSFNKQSRQGLFRILSGGTLDLLVIGGGITGASVFRDAALRGMSVALVEANDFASATSGRSSKLIHGGLRYLKNLGFRLAWESCHERNLHVRLNKRLVRPMPFLVPLYRGQGEPRALMRLGMVLYEGLSGFHNYRLHRFMSREETLSLAPALPVDGLTGGCLYYDAVVSDNRWTVETVKDGVRHGGVAVNHAPLTGLLREGGKVIGGRIQDNVGGEHYEVHARAVVNATGVFADQIRRMDDPDAARLVRLSKGTHLVFAEEDVPLSVTVVFSSPLDKRSLFLAKHEGCFLYGTSDDWEESDPGSFHARSGVGWRKGAVRLQWLSPASTFRGRRSRLRRSESRRSYRGLSVGPDQRNRRQVDDGADHGDSGPGSRHR